MSEMMAFVHGAPTATKKRTADEAGLSAQGQEVEEMREWRVAQLCGALHGRELSTKGRKKELVERLERAIRVDGKEAGESDSSGCSSSGGSSSSASGPSAVQ